MNEEYRADLRKKAWIFFCTINLIVLLFIFYEMAMEKDFITLLIFKALLDILIFASFGDFRKIVFDKGKIIVEK